MFAYRLISAVLLVGLMAPPVLAQETGPAAPPPVAGPVDPDADTGRDTITIGVGLGFVPSYEGSNSYVLLPVAAARGRLSGYNFSLRGTAIDVDLIRDSSPTGIDFRFGPAVNVNFNRNGRIGDPIVRALGRRKLALEAGGYAGISKTGVFTSPYDTVSATVTVLADTTGIHNSYVITPSIDYGTPLSRKAYVGVSLSGTWVGDGYARTYFAVDAAGVVASGLPIFANPRGGFKNYTVGVLGTYALTGTLRHGLGLFATGSYSRLHGDFARSPIVSIRGTPNQFFGAVGVGFTF